MANGYPGNSLVDWLKSQGQDYSPEARGRLWAQYFPGEKYNPGAGIGDGSGVHHNERLLGALRGQGISRVGSTNDSWLRNTANVDPIANQASAGGGSSSGNPLTSMPVPFQNANRDVGFLWNKNVHQEADQMMQDENTYQSALPRMNELGYRSSKRIQDMNLRSHNASMQNKEMQLRMNALGAGPSDNIPGNWGDPNSAYKSSLGLMGAGLDMPDDQAMYQSFGMDPTGPTDMTDAEWDIWDAGTNQGFGADSFELAGDPGYAGPSISSSYTQSFGGQVGSSLPSTLGLGAAINAPANLSTMNKLRAAGGKAVQSMDKYGGATNVLGGALMAGGNIMAMGQYGDAIGDVDDALGKVPGMIGQTLMEAEQQIGDARNIIKSGIESSRDTAGSKLELSLQDIANEPRNVVGNVKQSSNKIRRALQEGIDSTVQSASDKLQQSMTDIAEDKRDSLAYVESLREELKDKKEGLEKEKRQAGIGAAVGVGSIFADALLPGSGQVLRTGWNAYSTRT